MTALENLWLAAQAAIDAHPIAVHYLRKALHWATEAASNPGLLMTLKAAWNRLREKKSSPVIKKVTVTTTTTTTITIEEDGAPRRAA